VPSAARALDEGVSDSAASQKARKNPRSGDITGPLSNRAIVHKVIPQYPAWAEEQGIVGSVQIYFTVDASGTVRPNMQVRKTTGNVQLDQLAIEALKQWRFATSDAEGEWGIITFNFSLSS
jgi:TonB family protein